MDKYSKGMNEYEASIDVCMGGKVAEQLVYGSDKVTSGASSVSHILIVYFPVAELNLIMRRTFLRQRTLLMLW